MVSKVTGLKINESSESIEDIAISGTAGKQTGVLVNPGVNVVRSLRGIMELPEELEGMDYKDIKEMRIIEKYD